MLSDVCSSKITKESVNNDLSTTQQSERRSLLPYKNLIKPIRLPPEDIARNSIENPFTSRLDTPIPLGEDPPCFSPSSSTAHERCATLSQDCSKQKVFSDLTVKKSTKPSGNAKAIPVLKFSTVDDAIDPPLIVAPLSAVKESAESKLRIRKRSQSLQLKPTTDHQALLRRQTLGVIPSNKIPASPARKRVELMKQEGSFETRNRTSHDIAKSYFF